MSASKMYNLVKFQENSIAKWPNYTWSIVSKFFRRYETVTNMTNDKAKILDTEVNLHSLTSGHYCIDNVPSFPELYLLRNFSP